MTRSLHAPFVSEGVGMGSNGFLLIPLLILVALLVMPMASAITYPRTEAHGLAISTNGGTIGAHSYTAMNFTTNTTNLVISNVGRGVGQTGSILLLVNESRHIIWVGEPTWTNDVATVSITLPRIGLYHLGIGNNGTTSTQFYNARGTTTAGGVLTWNHGSYIGCNLGVPMTVGAVCNSTSSDFTNYLAVRNITFSTISNNILTFQVNNVVGGAISGFCVNASGNGSKANCSSGSTVQLNNITGNLTYLFYNISSSTYFNATNVSAANVTGDITVVGYTAQGHLNLSAYRLFLNTSIGTFNATNGAAINLTTTGSTIVPANNGSNTITVNVTGNYSKSVTCTLNTPLTTGYCNATGIYDNAFTIGGNASGTSVNTFTVNVTNTTLGAGNLYSTSTTNGSIVFPLLQGYYYNFAIDAPLYAFANSTQQASAATGRYNFTLLTYNTFELLFLNESTNGQITNATITVQLISDAYSNNYTTSNGTLIVSALTPEDYTIRYWREASVPRDYYVTLTNQSYNNISLYVLDSDISNIYLPIIQDQNIIPVSGATVKLMRYYIVTGNLGEYRIVEMAKTDSNGQSVLRVVPNIIDYKLMVSSGSATMTTLPTKFTASTNTYTVNFEQNPLTSILAMPSVTKSLVYTNSTLTYVFTWADTQNIVTEGCLRVDKYKNGVLTTGATECTESSSGSIIYTITDTNQTRYLAMGTLETNTEFSTYSILGPGVNFVVRYITFGVVGMIITLILFLSFVFLGSESGVSGVVISGFMAILIMGAFGIVAEQWESVVGIAIVIGIILYKVRS